MDTTSVQPVVAGIVEMSPGRLAALIAYAAGAVGVVAGGLALRATRRARRGGPASKPGVRRRGVTAAALGLASLVVGGAVVATADGGAGTGNGVAGGLLAIALGLVALILGGSALVGSRGEA